MSPISRFVLLLSLGAAGSLTAQTAPLLPFKFETTVNYSRGDYGLPQDTEVFAVPVSLSYETAAWTLRGTLPWLTIKGPASVIEGGGIPVRPTPSSESGFGDFVAALGYKFAGTPEQPRVSLTGRVKFPTGSESRGLSTGETDYYAQLDALQSFGRVSPFVTAGYRWLGRNTLFQLKDGFFASGGFAVRAAEGTSVGAAYEWREKIVDGGEHASELSVFLFHTLSDRWGLSLTALRGFTDASPNYGLSGSLIHSF